jgi:hypothetical protein
MYLTGFYFQLSIIWQECLTLPGESESLSPAGASYSPLQEQITLPGRSSSLSPKGANTTVYHFPLPCGTIVYTSNVFHTVATAAL